MNPTLTLRRILFWLIALSLALTFIGWSLSQTRPAQAQQGLTLLVKSQGQLKSAVNPGETLRPAQASVSAAPAQVPSQAVDCSQWHTIQAGETLLKIGRRYDVSWRRLAEINGLSNPNLIHAGARLCVQAGGTTTPPPSTGRVPTFTIVEVVRDGTVTIRTSNFPALPV